MASHTKEPLRLNMILPRKTPDLLIITVRESIKEPNRWQFLKSVVLISGLLQTSALVANPNSEVYQFDIAAGSMTGALSEFSEVSKVDINYPANTVSEVKSRGLKGSYTTEQALQQLLKGSDLSYRITGDNIVTIERSQLAEGKDPTMMPPVQVIGQAVFDATNTGDADYGQPKIGTATKTDTPIFETPISVQVIPKAVLQDQKTTRLKDALENVSGVRAQTTLGLGNGFIVRGFRTGRVFRNGLSASGLSIGAATEFDTANLESVEVLKGPAAILFGRIDPGGLINLVTKKPRDESFYSLEQRFGSYEFYRTEWDATGAVAEDRSVSYRFTGSYQDNNSFRDFNLNDRMLIHPSLTWKPSDATSITVDVEGLYQEHRSDRGLFAIGDRPAPVPTSRSYIEPNDPLDKTSKVNLGFDLSHSFNDQWKLRNRFLATFNDSEDISIKPANAFTVASFLDPTTTNRIYQRNIFAQTVDAETYTSNLDLEGSFEFLGARHKTLSGLDFTRSTGTYWTRGNFIRPISGLGIDIYNPVYGIDPAYFESALATPFPAGINYSYFRDEWYGLYMQDQITLGDSVHILGGGRYDWAKTGRGRGASITSAEAVLPTTRDEGFSPRFGLLYQPWNWLGIYGNWTTSFGANNGVTDSGKSIDPEIGEQFEAGFKTEIFDRRLTATAAYYHLVKQNILTRDQNSADPNAVAPIGEARSQGIEIDISGRITSGLNIIGSYAYTDARITKDNRGLQGHDMNNVPEHSGSLWVKYDVNDNNVLNGWSFGLGLVAAGQRLGDDENTFVLPGYARLDAFTAYSYKLGNKRLIAQFNIRNLLDKAYYESTDPFQNAPPRVGIYPGAPLTAIGSIRLEF